MNKQPDIVILGTGYIASQLAFSFFEKGLKISRVIGRNPEKTQQFAHEVKAEATLLNSNFTLENCVLFVALADNISKSIVSGIQINKNVCICHTSGTLPSAHFSEYSESYGVFYPFQTYSGKLIEHAFKEIPVIIEANDTTVKKLLTQLAESLEAKVVYLQETERLHLHLAGVITNNFTNYLVAKAVELLHTKHIDTNLLRPLLQKTLENVDLSNPISRQTGPAKRGDLNVMQKHIDALKTFPELQKVYKLLSEQIGKDTVLEK